MITLLLYFLAGVLQDVLAAGYIRAVNRKKRLLAPFLGAIITFVGVMLLGGILLSGEILASLIALCLGNALGTSLIVELT